MAKKDTANAVTLEYLELIQTVERAERRLLRAFCLLSFMEVVTIPTDVITRDDQCIYDDAILPEVIGIARRMVGKGQADVCDAVGSLKALCGVEKNSAELQLVTPEDSGGAS